MKPNLTLAAVSLAFTTVFTPQVLAADKPAAAQPSKGDRILRQVSAKLGGAQKFSFQAHREMDAALLPGRIVAEDACIGVSVQRPNKIAARSVSEKGVRRFIADGRRFTMVDEKVNVYATLPMRTTIDGLVERLDAVFGFTPPLAEFILSDPYRLGFRREAHTVSYGGRGTWFAGFFRPIECDRLVLTGDEADAELWVAVSDGLPRKLVATFKHLDGKPQLKVEFSKWNLAAPVTPADFAFTPPKGAHKIEMVPSAKVGKTK
ncbi:MAG: DUF2092 domain-containing protein [Chthoniobacter sp.]|nr:DUF2092 domain-containing protein [Chthoniobacter sp.]